MNGNNVRRLVGAVLLLVTATATAADPPLARWRGTDLAGGAAARFGSTHHGEAGVNYVYAAPTCEHASMRAEFELSAVVAEPVFLHVLARDDDSSAVCPIEIRLNDAVLFEGPNTFGKAGFTLKRFAIPTGVLKLGKNELAIINRAAAGQAGMPPWFMVARAAIGSADCDVNAPRPIEEDFVVRLPAERRPVPVPGSEFEIPCQVFIEAIGTKANPLLTQSTPELKLNKWGNIEIDANNMTSIPGVFAGGDIVRGAATVILAMGDGKNSATAIDKYLKNT